MKILTCAQGSTEWSMARLGVVTASEISAMVTPLGAVKSGEGPRSYLFRKLAEKVMGYAGDSGSTFNMHNGAMLEKIALPWYSFTYDTEIQRVGFCLSDDGRTGCSPDGLIGEDGGIEVKSPTAPIHLEYLLEGVVPKEYRCQVQFSLWVTKRKWWTFVSYSMHLPSLVLTVGPDPKFQDAFTEAVREFSRNFDANLAEINRLREAEAPKEQSR